MKIGVLKKFYFDLLIYLKQNNFFEDKNLLIYPFDTICELDIAIKTGIIDLALTSSSILYEEYNIFNYFVFVKNSFKIFGIQNGLDFLRKPNQILKIGIPKKSDIFKRYFYYFYNFFYGKSEKIQWIQIDDYEIDLLLDEGILNFAIILEPLTFYLLSKQSSILYTHKNKSEIPLVFVYKKDLKQKGYFDGFFESIKNIKKEIAENNLLDKFLTENIKKYSYLKNYVAIFSENFNEFSEININKIPKSSVENHSILNKEYDKEYDSIKNDIHKIFMYSINFNKSYNSSIFKEFDLIKEIIDNYKAKERILKLIINALLDKNKTLNDDLENRQQNLSDLFMQFRQTSENLLIKNIQVEQSIKEKDNLIAIISHDLKTPLSGIISITQQLLAKENDDEKHRKLKIILESGNTLLQLIENLLISAKDASMAKKLDEKVFSFFNLIDSVVANIKEKLRDKPVEFFYNIDDSIPKILIGDSLKFKQILYNFLGNSVKFTPRGLIELKIKLLEKKSDICKIEIEIKDSGIGISEDKIEHIFDPFVQEDETIKAKYGGTGLGLSIVKDFVELMGGKISCNSKKNFGTTFKIVIDFKISKETEKAERLEQINPYIVFKNSSVLILEDNLINQEVLRGYLVEYNTLKLVFKENGQQGLSELKKSKFDLILTDIMMPEMDGKEFCKNLRLKDKNTPVIALTAFDRKEEVEELIKLGFNDIIPKPYKKEDLIKGISKFIPIKDIIDDEKKFLILKEKARNSDKIDKFKKLFLEDLYNRYLELKEGLANKDKDKIRFFSHNLKGIAPTLGFPEFSKIAELASTYYKNDRWEELELLKEKFLQMVTEIEKKI